MQELLSRNLFFKDEELLRYGFEDDDTDDDDDDTDDDDDDDTDEE